MRCCQRLSQQRSTTLRFPRGFILSAVVVYLAVAVVSVPVVARAQAALDFSKFGTEQNTSGVGICASVSLMNGLIYLANEFPSVYGGTNLTTGNTGSQWTPRSLLPTTAGRCPAGRRETDTTRHAPIQQAATPGRSASGMR